MILFLLKRITAFCKSKEYGLLTGMNALLEFNANGPRERPARCRNVRQIKMDNWSGPVRNRLVKEGICKSGDALSVSISMTRQKETRIMA